MDALQPPVFSPVLGVRGNINFTFSHPGYRSRFCGLVFERILS